MRVTIIGLGLIGGSMAIDLKGTGFASKVIGVDNNRQHAEKALELNLVDGIADLQDAVKQGELVILAVPVQYVQELLPEVLDLVEDQIVIDVGSTKRPAVTAVENHPRRGRYVATHPMAGTEFSGPQAAVKGLFEGKTTIFCDVDQSDPQAVLEVSKLYKDLGMPIIHMDAREHDLHAAYVSHISHISSFALALTVLEQEKDRENIFNLASGGFDSTVRLAKSNKEMWSPIFAQNADNVLTVLDTYIRELERFKNAIIDQDQQALDELIVEANQIKRIL